MRRLPFLITGLILIAIAGVVFLPLFPALTVTHDGRQILCLSLNEGETFSIRYNHSVNRSPVIDTIERTGNVLTVRNSLFQTYGAGIPVLSDGVGTHRETTPEGILLTGIDAPHDVIHLLTGTYADHHILYEGREIQLKALAGEKQLIVLKADHASLVSLLFKNGK